MKICIIGVFSGDLDEGYKNISNYIFNDISKNHEVLKIHYTDLKLFSSWRRLKTFSPDIIHYLTAPTISSLIILRIAKLWLDNDTILVVSSLHPYSLGLLKNPILKHLISLLKPNLVLTQCNNVKELFEEIGCNTLFLPNGVDTKRFTPVDADAKRVLRDKYGIEYDKFIILHVGHIKTTRGIDALTRVQEDSPENQVIVVGSSHFGVDKDVYRTLTSSGCYVWNKFYKNIEEIYAISDCYVFPTPVGQSIFMPLSVLEAMSCNIPVITTEYEGLKDNFDKEFGLIFIKNSNEVTQAVRMIKLEGLRIENQRNIHPYSWENVTMRLESAYEEIRG